MSSISRIRSLLDASLATSKKKPPTNVSQALVTSTSPLDRPAFLSRLKTFRSAYLWSPSCPVTPVECARNGWRLRERDLLECVACKALVYGKLASSADPVVYRRSAENLRKKLTSAHAKFCIFAGVSTPPSLSDPFSDADDVLADFLGEVEATLAKVESKFGRLRLPKFSNRSQTRLMSKELLSWLATKVKVRADEVEVRSAILLAICGWKVTGSGGNMSSICCELCNSKKGVWAYCSVLDEAFPSEEIFKDETDYITEDAIEEVVSKELDVLAQEVLTEEREEIERQKEEAERQKRQEEESNVSMAVNVDESECNETASDSFVFEPPQAKRQKHKTFAEILASTPLVRGQGFVFDGNVSEISDRPDAPQFKFSKPDETVESVESVEEEDGDNTETFSFQNPVTVKSESEEEGKDQKEEKANGDIVFKFSQPDPSVSSLDSSGDSKLVFHTYRFSSPEKIEVDEDDYKPNAKVAKIEQDAESSVSAFVTETVSVSSSVAGVCSDAATSCVEVTQERSEVELNAPSVAELNREESVVEIHREPSVVEVTPSESMANTDNSVASSDVLFTTATDTFAVDSTDVESNREETVVDESSHVTVNPETDEEVANNEGIEDVEEEDQEEVVEEDDVSEIPEDGAVGAEEEDSVDTNDDQEMVEEEEEADVEVEPEIEGADDTHEDVQEEEEYSDGYKDGEEEEASEADENVEEEEDMDQDSTSIAPQYQEDKQHIQRHEDSSEAEYESSMEDSEDDATRDTGDNGAKQADSDSDVICLSSDEEDNPPNVDGAFDLPSASLSLKNSKALPFFHPVNEHLAWCPWVTVLSSKNVLGWMGYVDKLEQLKANETKEVDVKSGAGGERNGSLNESIEEIRKVQSIMDGW